MSATARQAFPRGGGCFGADGAVPLLAGRVASRPSPEQLLGELAGLQHSQRAAEVDAVFADDEAKRLASQVVSLEADKRALRLELERFRRKVAELEQSNQVLSPLLDEASSGLKDALERETRNHVKSVERQLLATEAENKRLRAQTEVEAQRWEMQSMTRLLAGKDAEAGVLQEELRAEQEVRSSGRVLAERLQKEILEVTASRDWERDARQTAEERAALLEMRVERLEQALRSASTKEAGLMAETQVQREGRLGAEATNRRLRLDLQEVSNQAVRAGETPYYMGCSSFKEGKAAGIGAVTSEFVPVQAAMSSNFAFATPYGAGLPRAGPTRQATSTPRQATSTPVSPTATTSCGAGSAAAAAALGERLARRGSAEETVSPAFNTQSWRGSPLRKTGADVPPSSPASMLRWKHQHAT